MENTLATAKQETVFQNLLNYFDENLTRLERVKNAIEVHSEKIATFLEPDQLDKKSEPPLPNSFTNHLSVRLARLSFLIGRLEACEEHLAQTV